MDLIAVDGSVLVAGPDTEAFAFDGGPSRGMRFRPGMLPRLLGLPAVELRNRRVCLADVRRVPLRHSTSLISLTTALAAESPSRQTAPWSSSQLRQVTRALAEGAAVSAVATDLGWSVRTFQRHCVAVYGYGPATLRRILRFRRASRLLASGVAVVDVAAGAGYADQPHLHREFRALAGIPLNQFASGAKRSTLVPSGSATVA
jgi:AraC-like DNA-binding protein